MDSYQVDITDAARRELRALPGHLRQRTFRLLQSLRKNPRPDDSRLLDAAKHGIQLAADTGLYHIRIDSWRVVYVVEETNRQVTVLAIRKRPPYQYDDLERLVEQP